MSMTEMVNQLMAEIDAFPATVSLRLTDLRRGTVLVDVAGDTRCVSASTIKVPILLCALESVRRGERKLTDLIPVPKHEILPDTEVFERGVAAYSLWELLYWMIVESDNTATNCMIDLLGCDTINEDTKGILGLQNTECNRKMLDWAAIAAGRNNYTSAADQERMYALLYHGEILTQALRETALDMLRRQRCMDGFLRYIPDNITVAHKTGGLDYLNHDAGIFYLPAGDYYLGIFTWDGPSPEGDSRQKQLIGRLTRLVYDEIK